MGNLVFRSGNKYTATGPIKPAADNDATGGLTDVTMKVRHDTGAGIKFHQTQAPGHAFTKVQVVAVMQQGFRD